jgi:hypothetical protein
MYSRLAQAEKMIATIGLPMNSFAVAMMFPFLPRQSPFGAEPWKHRVKDTDSYVDGVACFGLKLGRGVWVVKKAMLSTRAFLSSEKSSGAEQQQRQFRKG